MGNTKLTKVLDLDENFILRSGATFRRFGAGMNPKVVSPDEDFYDYMLTDLRWEDDLLLVNVTANNIKRGHVLGFVPAKSEKHNLCIKDFAKHFHEEIEKWFYIHK